VSDLQVLYEVSSFEIETNRSLGETLDDTQRRGVGYCWLVQCHRSASDRDIASPQARRGVHDQIRGLDRHTAGEIVVPVENQSSAAEPQRAFARQMNGRVPVRDPAKFGRRVIENTHRQCAPTV
jgi:hypothetical protein